VDLEENMRIAESDIEKHKNMSGKRKEEPEIAVVSKDWYARYGDFPSFLLLFLSCFCSFPEGIVVLAS
jgi:hypothetical protein